MDAASAAGEFRYAPSRPMPPAPRPSRLLAALLLSGAALGACEAEPSGGRDAIGQSAAGLQATSLVGTSLAPKTLALTFDDGPSARTAELSRYLHAESIRATFFVIGAHLAPTTLPNPHALAPIPGVEAVLAQLVADGHLVANHTTTHRDLVTEVLPTGATWVVRELAETDDAIAAHVPWEHLLFRAPYGAYNAAVFGALRGSRVNKYAGPVRWDIGGVSDNYPAQAADWACWGGQLFAGATPANGTGYATTSQCGDAYLAEIAAVGRGIVLMHEPYAWSGGNTVDLVKYLVPRLKAAGYAFVRADEIPAIAALLPPATCAATCATCDGPAPTDCTACAAGRHLSGRACLPCATCAPGTFTAAACTPTRDTACAACDPSCATCEGPGPTRCATCPAATFASAGACVACTRCADGAYVSAACAPTSDTACAACDPSCARCDGPGAAACLSCPPGRWLDGRACRACSPCPAGAVSSRACAADRDTACSPCEPGASAAAGATSCSPCPAGTAQDRPGQASCAACPAGAWSAPGATRCEACPPGTASAAGASTCTPVAPNADTTVDAGTGAPPATGGEERGCSASSSRRAPSEGASVLAMSGLAAAALRRRARALRPGPSRARRR